MNASVAQNRALLIGGTGAMGIPVVQQLLADTNRCWIPRILTRNTQSTKALELLALDPRVELVSGDVTNPIAVSRALEGVSAVFCNTDYWSLWDEFGESIETSVGIRLLELARHAEIDHFVYSSAEHTEELSDARFCAPHFDAKARVEAHILARRQERDQWYMEHTSVLRTAPYMENFQTYFLPRQPVGADDAFTFILPIADKAWTMVSLDDIGWFAAHMISEAEFWKGRDLAIASDRLTLPEIATAFADVTGLSACWHAASDEEFLSWGIEGSDDLINMFRFMREVGLERDLEQLRRIHPGLLDFRAWLRKTGWRGEPRNVQKLLMAD